VTANGGATKQVTKTVTVAATPPPPPPPGTATFTAVADSQVKSTSPTTKYGALATIRTRIGDASDASIYQSYLRFTVSGIGTAHVTGVKLRLFATDASPDGGRVYLVTDNTWSESTITWNVRPILPEPPIAPAGPAPLNDWREITLPVSAVPGDGTYNFGLATNSTNSALYSSREGANPPQLVLTTG